MMSTDKTQYELTPAAQQAMNELVEDYRQQLLRLAVENMLNNVSGERSITTQDVTDASKRMQKMPSAEPYYTVGDLLRYIPEALVIAGSLVLFLNLVYQVAIVRSLNIQKVDSANVLIWLGVMLGAMAVIALIVVIIQQRSTAQTDESALIGSFLKTWRQYEESLRQYSVHDLGETQGAGAYGELLRYAHASAALTPSEITELEKTRQMRNAVVHGREQFKNQDIEQAVKVLEFATSKLEFARMRQSPMLPEISRVASDHE